MDGGASTFRRSPQGYSGSFQALQNLNHFGKGEGRCGSTSHNQDGPLRVQLWLTDQGAFLPKRVSRSNSDDQTAARAPGFVASHHSILLHFRCDDKHRARNLSIRLATTSTDLPGCELPTTTFHQSKRRQAALTSNFPHLARVSSLRLDRGLESISATTTPKYRKSASGDRSPFALLNSTSLIIRSHISSSRNNVFLLYSPSVERRFQPVDVDHCSR